jgi:hypothetical protein
VVVEKDCPGCLYVLPRVVIADVRDYHTVTRQWLIRRERSQQAALRQVVSYGWRPIDYRIDVATSGRWGPLSLG